VEKAKAATAVRKPTAVWFAVEESRYQPEHEAYFGELCIGSNPVNTAVLTVIGSDDTSKGDFGSTGRLQEFGINHIDYETCNSLYDRDIVDSVMLCADVDGGGEDSCKSACETATTMATLLTP
jgi:hypothetical protein